MNRVSVGWVDRRTRAFFKQRQGERETAHRPQYTERSAAPGSGRPAARVIPVDIPTVPMAEKVSTRQSASGTARLQQAQQQRSTQRQAKIVRRNHRSAAVIFRVNAPAEDRRAAAVAHLRQRVQQQHRHRGGLYAAGRGAGDCRR